MMRKNIALLTAFSLTCLFTIAQQMNTYDSHWKEIDSLLLKAGRPQSALVLVNQVYDDAKKSANQVQMLKALLYRMELNKTLTEETFTVNLAALEEEISVAAEPMRSILNSIAAENYWQYLQANRWKLYDRSATTGFNKEEVATWGLEDLYSKISALFLASVKEEDLLQRTSLDAYEAVLDKGNARHLRPTLFDLLAHRALTFFENSERDITRPAFAFEIREPEAFAPAAAFAAHNFPSSDSLSLHHKALQLYQQLIAFHLKDARPDALLDTDIKRIQFVYTYGIHPARDSLYRQALEHIVQKYPRNATTSQAMFLLASWHLSKAATYDPLGDTTHRYATLEAKRICELALQQTDTSAGRQDCASLLQSLLQKTLSMQAETVTPPGAPFRMLVSYKNLGNAYFRLIRLTEETASKYGPGSESWKDEYWEGVAALPALDSFQYHLPETGDHQEHRAEIGLKALPTGEYALLASTDPGFSRKENTLALQYFYVSDIAYVNNGPHYYVLNRSTGEPLASARVQRWQEEYNYQQKRMQLRRAGAYTTDKNGYFRIPDTVKNRNIRYRLEISHGKNRKADRLFLKDSEYLRVYDGTPRQEPEKNQAFLFADRAIYRPGQILHFKGIVVTQPGEHKSASIVSNAATTVTLYNANGEPIDSLLLKTNAFGSYSGKFNLPAGTLNGYFSIRDTHNGTLSFRVEEYKRPRFYTEIPKPSGAYRLEDSVTVEGFAKSYAGNPVDGAGVTYRVVRKTIMPMWARTSYLPRIWPPFPAQETEISHGTTTTDASGRFTVRFAAIPDYSVPRDQSPVFFYEINADVTDINGETRSALATVSIGYRSLQLQLNLPAQMWADDLESIGISTTNMNGVFEKTELALAVYPLQAPPRLFRSRYWQQPDQFLMDREEYYRLFPHDPYADEQDMRKWPRGESVYDTRVTTKPGLTLDLPDTRLAVGWYVIEATATDKDGEPVKDLRYFRIDDTNLAGPELAAKLHVSSDTARPGEKVTYRLVTNQDRPFVIYELAGTDTAQRKFLRQSRRNTPQTITITDDYRGRLSLNTAFVKQNRVYTSSEHIEVPFFEKQLRIDYTSFRDKTLPGTTETWQVKISGHEGEQVAAELLTAMYDASLDQFTPHQWRIPGLWTVPVRPAAWSGTQNFKSTAAWQRIYSTPLPPGKPIAYDRLRIPHAMVDRYYKRDLAAPQTLEMQSNLVRESTGYDQSAPAAYAETEGAMADTGDAGTIPPAPPETPAAPQPVTPRTDLRETAFFFPHLQTDTTGNVSFSFTTPEALTEWRWMLLTHTKELAFGYGERSMVTQKQLMVQPNAPRFLREGDRIDFSAKLVNMTNAELSGRATLELFDPANGETVDGIFNNISPVQFFTTGAQQSTAVTFSLQIPFRYARPVGWRIIATATSPDSAGTAGTSFSDGEESMLPVISNRMLITETLPLPLQGTTEKKFSFDKLLKSGSSQTLQQHGITVEFTSNPAWYAVQALPYLTETTIENAEQIFNRYYANALASKIAAGSTRFREVMEQWRQADTAALLSQLEKNEALKSILLQETPWVLEARSESEQKKNITLLFDMLKMSTELQSSLAKLHDMQAPTGGFVWFKGGPEDRYMTQYILTGLGRLQNLGALGDAFPTSGDATPIPGLVGAATSPTRSQTSSLPGASGAKLSATSGEISPTLRAIISAGISYLDGEIKKAYERQTKDTKEPRETNIGYIEIQYLYMRSFFNDIGIAADALSAYNYFRKQAQQSWIKQNSYMRAMIALSLHRTGDITTAKKILTALKETAIRHPELGTYWKDMSGGYYWHQAPIASQTVMIEAFATVTNDLTTVNGIKTWLLKNKQTRRWKSTKATADACYALLMQGSDWMTDQPAVAISLGHTQIHSSQSGAEMGTGYFTATIPGDSVRPSMGNITVKLGDTRATDSRPAWGAVYWQYFEDMDKITPAATPLQLSKKLFVVQHTDRGPVLQPVENSGTLHPGDRLTVRIELKVDRPMEYLHMKDMRAAGTEPLNVLSRYKWQGGLGYYETTRDASTDFFFNLLPKGVYVFEYELNVTHTGTFSNGITSIQCLYAPEFSSHSEGLKISVQRK